MNKPELIEGGISIDDRGKLSFINAFSFDKVKRFYLISNHKAGFIRAWHAHKREAKYVTVLAGAALIGAVEIENWDSPSKDAKIWKFVLSEHKPSIVYIPTGYANGFMNFTQDTKLLFFSTSSVEESKGDDFRFEARYWNPWEVVER